MCGGGEVGAQHGGQGVTGQAPRGWPLTRTPALDAWDWLFSRPFVLSPKLQYTLKKKQVILVLDVSSILTRGGSLRKVFGVFVRTSQGRTLPHRIGDGRSCEWLPPSTLTSHFRAGSRKSEPRLIGWNLKGMIHISAPELKKKKSSVRVWN